MSRRIWMYYLSGIYDGCDLAIKTLNTLCTSIWYEKKNIGYTLNHLIGSLGLTRGKYKLNP